MPLVCNCPEEVLTTIIVDGCEINIGQIQKLIFQKQGNLFDTAGGTPNDPTLLADWLAFTAATDETKAVVTPLIKADPQIEDGGVITKGGGDNTTLNGVELVTGQNPGKFSAKFNGLGAAAISAMRALQCAGALGVYLVNEDGTIIGHSTSTITQTVPIPLTSFNLGSKVNQGFGEVDYNEIIFSLPSDWDEKTMMITPADFNALVDLDITS